jgi:elongation factor Ts
MTVTAADVKALRDRTGAAMMDCKSALAEADGDVDRAIEILRVKGQASAAKREGRGTEEGVIASYIHANDKVGAMVEVQCETDFVARNEDFKAFAYQVALHVAATAPRHVSSEEIPEEEREAEKRVFEEKAREEGKPDDVVEKIVAGQLEKWAREVALLDQAHVNTEKHESKSIEELRQELAAKTGENVRVARFAYFRVGEG